MKRHVILPIMIVLAAMAVQSAGQSLPGLYLTNAVVLSNGLGQFEVRTPDASKPFVILYSYAKDFSYLSGPPRWSVWKGLDSATNRYILTSPEPMSAIGTIFFRAAKLGEPINWLDYSISSSGTLADGVATVSWPQQPIGWHAQLTVQNGTNFPAASEVFFTGPPGTFTNAPTESDSDGDYKHYYNVSGAGIEPPIGMWHVQYGAQMLIFTMADPQVSSRYVVMVPNTVVSNGFLTSVSWTYHEPITGAVLPALPAYIAGSASVRLDETSGDTYDSPPADRARTNYVFEPPVAWSNIVSLHIGFHDDLGNTFSFYHYK